MAGSSRSDAKRAWRAAAVHYVRCDICEKSVRSDGMVRHKRTHDSDPERNKVQCDICGNMISKENFPRHMQNVHENANTMPCFFRGCSLHFRYDKRRDLMNHLQSEHDAYHDQGPKVCWETAEQHKENGTKIHAGSGATVSAESGAVATAIPAQTRDTALEPHSIPSSEVAVNTPNVVPATEQALQAKEGLIREINKERGILVRIADRMDEIESRMWEIGMMSHISPSFRRPTGAAELPNGIVNMTDAKLSALLADLKNERLLKERYAPEVQAYVDRVHWWEDKAGKPRTVFDDLK